MPPTNIGQAIANDIKRMTSQGAMKEVYRELGDIYYDSIEHMNEKSSNPDGTPRQELNRRYAEIKSQVGRQPKPDFYFSGNAHNSFDYGIKEEGVRFRYSNAEAAEYMYDHEYGYNGMPQRRQLPVENDASLPFNDMGGSEQKENIREVEQTLTRHLMKDRTVKASG